jgi:bacteriocin biosynthesis cyclodehydratase domain-containing protein
VALQRAEAPVNARGLQLIRLADGRVVLKRGVHEVLVSGESTATIVEPLLTLLDGTRTRDEVVAEFPGPLRGEVSQLVDVLAQRGLVADAAAGRAGDGMQASFYADFGPSAAGVVEQLRTASIVVVGANLISRSLVRSLLELDMGRVMVVRHPILDNETAPSRWLPELEADEARIEVSETMPGLGEVDEPSILCGTCDLGEAEALLDLNRLALAAGTPYLPAWVSELVGYVGPLIYPLETACLRCYRVRRDSNDPRYDIAEAVRAHMTSDRDARRGVGLLPPMAAVVGEIAAMEVVKAVGRFAPSDAVARSIEINLVSFGAMVRRVLKVPRCPDCSDVMRRDGVALMRGPQLPYRK